MRRETMADLLDFLCETVTTFHFLVSVERCCVVEFVQDEKVTPLRSEVCFDVSIGTHDRFLLVVCWLIADCHHQARGITRERRPKAFRLSKGLTRPYPHESFGQPSGVLLFYQGVESFYPTLR